jgi:hypothetical protein
MAMEKPPSKLVHIAQKKSPKDLSKGQKQFKALIKKIDAKRKEWRAWQAVLPAYEKKYAAEFVPLDDLFRERQGDMLVLLDRWHGDKVFTKAERKKILHLIAMLIDDLSGHDDRPELKAIFDKYLGKRDIEAEQDVARAMIKDMFGLDIEGHIDPDDPEALLDMMKQAQQRKDEQDAAPAGGAAHTERKKSASQIAREAREDAANKEASFSVREVYRKLASSLHPDREPDPAERARKTDLMQRANVAYDKGDLLQLLELQLEVEHIDEKAINNIAEDKLKHYNRILKEQLEELALETETAILAFSMRFGVDIEYVPPPDFLMVGLGEQIIDLKVKLEGITADVSSFADPKKVKSFLKDVRVTRRQRDEDFFPDFDFD